MKTYKGSNNDKGDSWFGEAFAQKWNFELYDIQKFAQEGNSENNSDKFQLPEENHPFQQTDDKPEAFALNNEETHAVVTSPSYSRRTEIQNCQDIKLIR